MTDHKFTDEQIIKGLEICGANEPCDECPYKGTQCFYILPRDAADLVNRQKAEITRLITSNSQLEARVYEDRCTIEKLQAIHDDMNESLRLASEANKDMAFELQSMRGAANSYKMHYETARAEAIKEFADNVKAIFECDLCFDADVKGYILNEIDELVKEMTEGQK